MLILAGLVTALALVFFIGALRAIHISQSGAFYATRKQDHRRGLQRLFASFICLLTAIALALSVRFSPNTNGEVIANIEGIFNLVSFATTTPNIIAPTPALTLQPTPTDIATTVQTSTSEPIQTAEPSPTITPVPTTSALTTTTPSPITATTTITITSTPLTATTTITAHKVLKFRAVGTGVGPGGTILGTGSEFERGLPKIVVFFDFKDVPPKATVQHRWFHEGNRVHSENMIWQTSGNGIASMSWAPNTGLIAGLYEVHVFVNDTPQFVANFLVR